MVPPRHYHASPLPSFCTIPAPIERTPSFVETLLAIWTWWRGAQPSWKDRVREARAIDALVEEMAEEGRMGGKDKPIASNAAAQPTIIKKAVF